MRLFFYKHRFVFNHNTDRGNFFRKQDSDDPKSLSVYDMSYAYGRNFSHNTEKPFHKKCAYDVNDMSLCTEEVEEDSARHDDVRVRGSDKTELPLTQQLSPIKLPLQNRMLNHLFYSFFYSFQKLKSATIAAHHFFKHGRNTCQRRKSQF